MSRFHITVDQRYTHAFDSILATRITAEQMASVQHHFSFDAFDFPLSENNTEPAPTAPCAKSILWPVHSTCVVHLNVIQRSLTCVKPRFDVDGIGVPDAVIGYQAAVHIACEQQNGR
ncbi:hypothetical protein T03_40 [Trichinella britovi]|uniref:Uncharacterized protein n=1 Tax=Trichinella britovi TaxID=45882 RepID=A0A0V1CE95_TRIBR|nr:hypothetical protein T03_40 [Trichinella britovi]